jgi:hypothetical protein
MLLHCKPSTFDEQFCAANAAIFPSHIFFQSNQKKIFQPEQQM